MLMWCAQCGTEFHSLFLFGRMKTFFSFPLSLRSACKSLPPALLSSFFLQTCALWAAETMNQPQSWSWSCSAHYEQKKRKKKFKNQYKIESIQMWWLCAGAACLVWNYHLWDKINQGITISAVNSSEEAKRLAILNKDIHGTWMQLNHWRLI